MTIPDPKFSPGDIVTGKHNQLIGLKFEVTRVYYDNALKQWLYPNWEPALFSQEYEWVNYKEDSLKLVENGT